MFCSVSEQRERERERVRMGGKGRRRREKNYRAAHGGNTRLPPPPDPSKHDALPSKLRKIMSFTASTERQNQNQGSDKGSKDIQLKRENKEEDVDTRQRDSNGPVITPEPTESCDEFNKHDPNEKKKKKRKRKQVQDLRFEMEMGKTKTKLKRQERQKK